MEPVPVPSEGSIVDRVIRAVKLDPDLYRQVGEDESKTPEAFLVVALAAAIGGLGSVLFTRDVGFGGWVAGVVVATAVGFTVWTGILYLVGKLFQGQATYTQLLRGVGFASAPYVLAIIPIIGGLAGAVWSLVCQIRAVREINRVSDGGAAATVLIPFGVLFVLFIILAVVAGLALFAALSGVSSS